jgi:ABC-2 type transport system ATP-binding protein
MPPIVRTERLTKDYTTGFWRKRPQRALDSLSIEIHPGDVFGLLGPNGAGKSTTLKLINNLIWPTSGRAEVFGRPPGDVDARKQLGFLPENPTFYDHLSAEELLAYFAGLFGYTGAERKQRAGRALDRVGIGAERGRPLRTYSKGMIQRVGLAQAIVNDAQLLILDEPMSGLDPLGRRDIRELILGLREEGRTVLFSSHILSDAEMLCNRAAILARGQLKAVGSLAELTTATDAATAGWEVVVSGVSKETAERLRARVVRMTTITGDRYRIEIGGDVRPEPLIAELAASGAALISVAPVRTTLEDVFVRHVGHS